MVTRDAASKAMNAIASKVDYLMGGSGYLSPSTKAIIKGSDFFEAGQYQNRNIAWGVREHGMCAANSGLALHGGIRAYASTFFIFTDYARPAIRLASIMRLPLIYIMIHDSIGFGKNGTMHQPNRTDCLFPRNAWHNHHTPSRWTMKPMSMAWG